MSISIYIHLYLSISISIYIHLYLSISISIYIYLYLSISISISISLSIYLSLYLSIYLYSDTLCMHTYIYIILLYIHHFNQFNHRYQQQTCQKVDPRPDTMAFTSSSVGCEVPHCVRTYCSFASSSVSTSGVGGWEMENMCEPIVNHASMSTLCLYIYIYYIYLYLYFILWL